MDIRQKLTRALCIIVSLIGLTYVSGVLKLVGLHLGLVSYVSLFLMLCLIVTFLHYPAKKGTKKQKIPWYDVILICFSVAGAGYAPTFTDRWSQLLYTGKTSTIEVILCFMLIIAILEAARRMIGWAMPVIASFFIFHLMFGEHFPGVLMTPPFSLQRITSLFYLSPDGIFGVALRVSCTVVVMFMIFAAFLRNSDAGKYIIDGAFALTGRWTGGPAKAAVLASSALGTLTGDTAANVATTGTLTIPLMIKTGYSPEFAGAVESVSSNGGQIMPPVMGMVAFIMAELLGMSYWEVCVAAFLPGLLYYISVFLQVHFEAVQLGLTGVSKAELPDLSSVVKEGFPYVIPIGVLVYYLAIKRMPAEYACLLAIIVLLAIIIIIWQTKKDMRRGAKEWLNWTVTCVEEGIHALLLPTAACAIAGIIIGSISSSGLGSRISIILIDLSGQNVILLLLLTAISSFVLGMGMTSIPCYLMLAVIVGPTLTSFGVLPIAAHLFFFYFGIVSFITPPVAVAAFIASGIAKSNPMKTAMQATRLGIVTFIIPFMFVFNPSLLLIGSATRVLHTIFTAIIGVSLLAASVEGYLWGKLRWFERLLFFISALVLLWPGWMTDVWGFIVGGFGVGIHLMNRKRNESIKRDLLIDSNQKYFDHH